MLSEGIVVLKNQYNHKKKKKKKKNEKNKVMYPNYLICSYREQGQIEGTMGFTYCAKQPFIAVSRIPGKENASV